MKNAAALTLKQNRLKQNFRPTKTAWHEFFGVLKDKQILHKTIVNAIQRATLTVISLLPQVVNVRAISLDVLLKTNIPLTMKHFEYIMLKTFSDKENPNSMLHNDFVKKLAACKDRNDFISLANDVNTQIEQQPALRQLSNMVKEMIKYNIKNLLI